MLSEKDFRIPTGLERCRPLVDRLYRGNSLDVKLNKSDRNALNEFGALFDRDNPVELAKLAGAAGLSMADLTLLTGFLKFQRSQK